MKVINHIIKKFFKSYQQQFFFIYKNYQLYINFNQNNFMFLKVNFLHHLLIIIIIIKDLKFLIFFINYFKEVYF